MGIKEYAHIPNRNYIVRLRVTTVNRRVSRAVSKRECKSVVLLLMLSPNSIVRDVKRVWLH